MARTKVGKEKGKVDAFKKKEEAFKKKNNLGTSEEKSGYIPQKTERDKALEFLEKRGFKVSIKDGILYCECKDEDEFDKYKSTLISNFGRDGKAPFSFGGCLKNGFRKEENNG